ncbi:MAG: hypothetical protein K6A35_07085 [bacterium]|nr:hypothetical protein [bacterium]
MDDGSFFDGLEFSDGDLGEDMVGGDAFSDSSFSCDEASPIAAEAASSALPWKSACGSSEEASSCPWEVQVGSTDAASSSLPWESASISPEEVSSCPWESNPSSSETAPLPWESASGSSEEASSCPWEVQAGSTEASSSSLPWETASGSSETVSSSPWESRSSLSGADEKASDFLPETNCDHAAVGGDAESTGVASEAETEMRIFDANGDGVNDSACILRHDSDGHEELVRAYDDNQDGVTDRLDSWHDYDGDGKCEAIEKLYSASDGTVHYRSALDLDGDGLPDLDAELQADNLSDLEIWQRYRNIDWEDGDSELLQETLDNDIDGIVDLDLGSLERGDGFYDFEAELAADPALGELKAVWSEYKNSVLGGTYADELEHFNPLRCDPELVCGDPAASMEHWEFQGNSQRCALYSQKFVLEELTGRSHPIEELTSLAKDNGWFSEIEGTPLLNLDKVLQHYGVETKLTFHNSLDDVEQLLRSGHRLICTIDADEIWNGQGDDLFSPCSAPNHAVQIIGVDRSDPQEPMIILNDSGTPGGRGEMVPWSAFSDAWEDGDRALIIAKA